MMSDWLVEHSALSSTHRSNSPLLAGRNCQSQTFYKENSLLWATCSATVYTKINKQIGLSRQHLWPQQDLTIQSPQINWLLNVKFILLSSVLSCLMLNKPLLIIRQVIFVYLFTSRNAYLLFCFLWKGILVEQRRKKNSFSPQLTDYRLYW